MADNKSLPLPVRKNFRDNEGKKTSNLSRMQAATGVTWEFELDPSLEGCYNAYAKADESKNNDFARIVFEDYIGAVATMFEKSLSDDMTKEAFLEACASRKLKFKFVDTVDWQRCVTIADGALVIVTSKGDFGSWMSYYSDFKIDPLL